MASPTHIKTSQTESMVNKDSSAYVNKEIIFIPESDSQGIIINTYNKDHLGNPLKFNFVHIFISKD